MKMRTNIAILAAVAGLGYAAGHVDLFSVDGAQAVAAAQQDITEQTRKKIKKEIDKRMPNADDAIAQEAPPEMDEDMLVMMKAGSPGAHHERLNCLIGEWTGEFHIVMEPGAEPMVSAGTITREWVLDGRYVKEVVKAKADWGEFEGIGYVGYDNVDGVYKSVWIDSMSTGIYTETATMDPDTMIMTTRGSHRDPVSGHVQITMGKMDMSDKNEQVYEGYMTTPEGKTFKHFTGKMARVKK